MLWPCCYNLYLNVLLYDQKRRLIVTTDNSPEFVNKYVPSFLQSSSPVNHASLAGIGDDFAAETASPVSRWPTPAKAMEILW